MVIPSRSALPGQDKQYSDSHSTLLPQVLSRRSALGHMVLLSGAQTASQLSTFGATVLVARVLGPTDFGWFSVALTTVALLSQLPGSGLDLGAMRLSALHHTLDVGKSRVVLRLLVRARESIERGVDVHHELPEHREFFIVHIPDGATGMRLRGL